MVDISKDKEPTLIQKLKQEFEDNWCGGSADDEDYALLLVAAGTILGAILLILISIIICYPVVLLWVIGTTVFIGLSAGLGVLGTLSVSRWVNRRKD